MSGAIAAILDFEVTLKPYSEDREAGRSIFADTISTVAWPTSRYFGIFSLPRRKTILFKLLLFRTFLYKSS